MIYPSGFENKLGFDIVRRRLRELCQSPMATEYLDAMEFSADYRNVYRQLAATAEMLRCVDPSDTVPTGGINDIRPVLARIIPVGTHLTIDSLVPLRSMLEACRNIRDFFNNDNTTNSEKASTPVLNEIAAPIEAFPQLIAAIDRTADRYGNILDNASAELSEIRRKLRSMANSINTAMRKVMATALAEGWIDKDTAPTIRDGRLVLPVSPAHKRKIGGIVHDESATGKTVYIEPAHVVEANNTLRILQNEEHREIIRILTELANTVRPHIPLIKEATAIVGEIDFIHAKALYARETGANMPHLSENCQLEWYGAEHPVLQHTLRNKGQQIVPLDITLTPANRILVISGPNAGGKSVCLKTVGILQYMLQCGMLPTAYANSHFGFFNDIFMDIGDDQSIENDLSTYSSHLKNMKTLVREGNCRSLILIDEFGSGTEPQIGAALAQAILHRLNDIKMWGVITTHYQNLKHFAEDTDGLINGSMLYDRQLMQPLFKLSIGNPGSSFAIEIARKTGLPNDIIEEAKQIVGSDYINMDRYLLDIARDKKYWENKRSAIKQKERKLDEITDRYQNDAETLREKRREIIAQAKEEAKKIVEGTNAAIERTISDIRRHQAERERTREQRRKLTETLNNLTDTATPEPEPQILRKAPHAKKGKQPNQTESRKEAVHLLEDGDHVRLDGEGVVGRILSVDNGKAVVVFGALKTTVAVSRLKYTTAKIKNDTSTQAAATASTQNRQRQLSFKTDIDVRGFRADEAVQAATYFIDDAIQYGIERVRILHGTGTGALRQAIRQYLATIPGVSSYRDEHVQFGGAGITVVDLK